MLTFACVVLAAIAIALELHPRIPSHNLFTKISLAVMAVCSLLFAGGVRQVIIWLILSMAFTLLGLSYRYVFDRRRQRVTS